MRLALRGGHRSLPGVARVSVPRPLAGILLFSLSTLLLSGCIDKELGLDATIQRTAVTVTGDMVSVSMDMTYRVGEHADGPRRMQPQAIELYVDGDQVGAVTPDAPAGFVATLEPGQSESTTLEGTEAPVAGADRLCGATVTVLFRWLDATSLEIGMTDAATMDVTC